MLRNDFEKKISRQLKKRKIPFENETERIPYTLTGVYIPDFILYKGLVKIYVECKGHFRREDKRKLAAVVKQHPEIDLRIVFYRLDKQNIRWAEKHKIHWSVGSIPNEWLCGRECSAPAA